MYASPTTVFVEECSLILSTKINARGVSDVLSCCWSIIIPDKRPLQTDSGSMLPFDKDAAKKLSSVYVLETADIPIASSDPGSFITTIARALRTRITAATTKR